MAIFHPIKLTMFRAARTAQICTRLLAHPRMDYLSIQTRPHGNIQVIFGPMFSGKTTELIRRVKRFSIAKKACLIIKYAKDQRYSVHGVATHDKQVSTARACSALADLSSVACDYDVIGIDEGQFVSGSVNAFKRASDSVVPRPGVLL